MTTATDEPTRIFLWCWPRSISTAVEKCLSFVDGVQTWHEPYTVVFNGQLIQEAETTGRVGAVEQSMKQYSAMMQATAHQPNPYAGGKLLPMANFTYPWVKSKLEEAEPGKKYVIIKDTAMAVHDHLDSLPDVPTRHTFIIRHPYRFLTSQRKMFLNLVKHEGDPAEFDMFSASTMLSERIYKQDSVLMLWKHVQETGKDPNPIIIDADDVTNHPDKILPKYLEALGIPFKNEYLTWDASEDIVKTWKGSLELILLGRQIGIFERALKSSCFQPNSHQLPKREELSADILKIVDSVLAGYEEMYENRIKPE